VIGYHLLLIILCNNSQSFLVSVFNWRQRATVMNLRKLFFLGFLVGMRSMTLPAMVSDYLATHKNRRSQDFVNGVLSDVNVAKVTKALAAGELLLDKLPFLPARTTLLPLAERMTVAGVLAAGLSNSKERLPAALIAAVSAAVGSYAAYELRRRAGDQLQVSDLPIALTEDALTVGGSLLWRDSYLEHQ
jgi:uncharacterized membrane protein